MAVRVFCLYSAITLAIGYCAQIVGVGAVLVLCSESTTKPLVGIDSFDGENPKIQLNKHRWVSVDDKVRELLEQYCQCCNRSWFIAAIALLYALYSALSVYGLSSVIVNMSFLHLLVPDSFIAPAVKASPRALCNENQCFQEYESTGGIHTLKIIIETNGNNLRPLQRRQSVLHLMEEMEVNNEGFFEELCTYFLPLYMNKRFFHHRLLYP